MSIGQWDHIQQADDSGDWKQIKMTSPAHILHQHTHKLHQNTPPPITNCVGKHKNGGVLPWIPPKHPPLDLAPTHRCSDVGDGIPPVRAALCQMGGLCPPAP